MKHWNRILAALLAALMLAGAFGAVAETDVELDLDVPGNPGEIKLEIDPEAIGADSEIGPDEGLELDGLELPDLDPEIEIEDNLLVGDTEAQTAEPAQSNASDSDFEIENGVLVEYKGEGGNVTIPDGVTSIGRKAFSHCESLTSITIPGSVSEICNGMSIGYSWSESDDLGAFSSCTNLVNVTISNGLTDIGDNAFYHCPKLKNVTLPDSVTRIGKYAFYECESLSSIIIPKGVMKIENEAFRECNKLTDILIPNSVTSIGDNAFRECEKLTSVTIPDSIKKWGEMVFLDCTNLTNLKISEGVTSIGSDAFWGCTELTSITIPASVNDIKSGAFGCCTGLTDVTILSEKIYICDVYNELGYDRDYDGDYIYNAFYHTSPTFHIISGSEAIEWAEENGYDYVIINNAFREKYLKLKSEQTHKLTILGKKYDNITWSSSDKSVATVDNGKVTGKKVGKCVISAKLSNGKTLKCSVTVYDPAEISVKSLSLNLGQTHKLNVSGLLKRKVTWKSSNTAVATVKNGKITPKKTGKCTITATLGKGKYVSGKTLKCKLTVTDPAALSKDSLIISAVDFAKIRLTGRLKRKVTWSTSDANVVKITRSDADSVTFRAVNRGEATVTAKVEGGKALKCAVTVVSPLTIKEDWDDDFDDLAPWEVGVKFTNHSNKKIIYVTFDILQYNNRGDKLQSPYDYYYFNNDLDPHSSRWDNYQVNDDTRSVKFKIREVTFADKTTWKP